MTDDLIYKLEEIGKLVTETTGSHSPQVVVVEKTGKLAIIVMPFKNDSDKEKGLMVLRKTVQAKHIDRYFVIMEAWIGKNIQIRPRDDKERKEALCVTEYTRSLTFRSIINFFHKEEGKVIWDKREEYDNKDRHTTSRWNVYLEDAMDENVENIREKYNV